MSDKQQIFKIDKEFLESYFGEALKKEINPKSILQIAIYLPFQIPFNNTIAFSHNKDEFICFNFLDIEYEIKFPEEFAEDIFTDSFKKTVTRVELVLITNDELLSYHDKSYRDYFFKLLTELNNLIFSYQINSNSISCSRVSSSDFLNKASNFRVIDFHNWENKYEALFVFNELELYLKKTIDNKLITDLIGYSVSNVKNWTPFLSAEESSLNAIRNFLGGKYKESIIESQISVELYLCAIYIYVLVEEGCSSQDATKYVIDTSYKKLVTRDFPGKLGGIWDVNRKDTAFGNYWNKSYELRNNIIHGGYFPNYGDAQVALERSNEFREYVLGLIKNEKKRFPNLFNYLNLIYRGNFKTFGTRAYNKIPKYNSNIFY